MASSHLTAKAGEPQDLHAASISLPSWQRPILHPPWAGSFISAFINTKLKQNGRGSSVLKTAFWGHTPFNVKD